MSKGHLPVIAKVQNPTTLGELEILAGFSGSGTVAEVYSGNGPVSLTRAELVSLRDQINTWLQANP